MKLWQHQGLTLKSEPLSNATGPQLLALYCANNNNNNTLFLKNACHASLNAFYKDRLKHKDKNLKIYEYRNQKANLKR